ncbi:hypothetical protein IWW48_002631 [Coemansia sp. RSA 1200]|nr:hypothetical protein IWW48_002631 [Coemansia sp. RSA 1200]
MSAMSPSSSMTSKSHMPDTRLLTAEEKELKRKISHSAIEKRRRERTNMVLRELQSIIPGLSKSGKIQKLEILEAAAEYIRDLTAAPKPIGRMKTSSPYRQTKKQSIGSSKQHGKRSSYLQEYSGEISGIISSQMFEEGSPSETILEQQKHPAVATPMSVSSNTSNGDSSDDALVNNLPKDMSNHTSSSPDPSSMKVNFLLC